MQLSRKSFVRFGIFAAAAVAAYMAVGLLVHADSAPVITTTIRDTSENVIASANVGASVHVVTQVASSTNSAVPQGDVDISVYPTASCSGTPTQTFTNLTLSGGFATSTATTTTASGLAFKAHYSGDASNVAADGPCITLNATANNSSVTTNLSATSVNTGTSVHDSATLNNVTANAGGNVTYTIYSDSSCTTPFNGAGVKPVTNGVVPDSDSFTFNTAGTYYWQAAYGGDANNNASKSTCGSEVLTVQAITKTSPTISTTYSTTTSTILVGNSIHDSATLTGETSDAGGTVSYKVYSNNSCTTLFQDAGTKPVTNGTVADSDNVAFNTPGTYYWQAVYSGDAKNNGVTSNCTSEVLTVTAAPNPTKTNPTISTTLSTTSIQVGTQVYDSVTLNGKTADAGGNVTFKIYNNSSCTTLYGNNGSKTVTNGTVPNSEVFTFNEAGTFYWQVEYSGDANNNPATSTCANEVVTVANHGGTTPPPAGNNTLSGTVFNDLNKNGVKDSGEAGIAGVTVDLYNKANFNNGKYDPVFKTVVTDGNGAYSFSSLADGTYSIEQLKKTGWKQTSEDFKSVVLSGSAGKSGLDFANVAKKNDNGKDNGKHKKDCSDDNDNSGSGNNNDDDDDNNASSTHGWFKMEGNNGLHLGWSIGKGNQGKNKHGQDD